MLGKGIKLIMLCKGIKLICENDNVGQGHKADIHYARTMQAGPIEILFIGSMHHILHALTMSI
jgi:hypothetical protein